MNKSLHHGVRVFGVLVLAGLCLMLSGCDELTLKTLISIRTQGGICVSITTGSDDNPGTPDAPKKTIDAAIEYLQSNDFIADVLVAAGDYHYDYGTGNPLTVAEGISLYGGYSTDFSTRDPEVYETRIIDDSDSVDLISNPNRAVYASVGITRDTVIDGFTIQGGGGEYSVGIFCHHSSPTISDNRIYGGTGSARSYGIFCQFDDSEPMIRDNREINGGESSGSTTYGVYTTDGADPYVTGNYIHGGNGNNTYGILNSNGSDSTVVGNNIHGGAANLDACGIRNSYASPKIWNNTIFGGSPISMIYTPDTIGVGCYGTGTPLIYNNTISSGTGDFGCGLYISNAIGQDDPSTPDIRNNIIFNSSKSSGYCVFEANPNGVRPVAIRDNDFWDSDGTYFAYRASDPTTYFHSTDIPTTFNNLNGDPDWPDCTIEGNDGVNPKLVDEDGAGDIANVLDNDWHIDANSPWPVKAGGDDLSEFFAHDKDGVERTTIWSVGAYEYDS